MSIENDTLIIHYDKLVRVVLVRENPITGDRIVMELNGKEAEKWYKAIESQAVYCRIHGMKFPFIDWEISK